MSQVTISVDNREVREAVRKAPEIMTRGLRHLVEGNAIDVQGEIIRDAPVGVTGDYRRSVQYKIAPMALEAEIMPAAKYAVPLEMGSRPHWVSVRPGTSLRTWAERKGIPPYAVQRSIARKGTKAHPIVKPVYDRMKPRVQRNFENGVNNLVEVING